MSTSLAQAEPKAQHYIPKFYLKGFTDKQGVLWVFEKFKAVRPSKPKEEAHRPDYYTHTERGERNDDAEDALKVIESKVAPVIRKLANPQYDLTPENASSLILFVAIMFARVPSWRENVDKIIGKVMKDGHLKLAQDKERFHKSCADMEKVTGKPLKLDYEELRQYVLKGEFEVVQASKAYNLRSMFECAFMLAAELGNFSYQVYYPPEGKVFVTSDSPVFTVQPDRSGRATIGVGVSRPGVEVCFPLNKKACLMLKRAAEPARVFIKESAVNLINKVTMATATQYLYTSEGHRRLARLFNQNGCKVRPGKESYLPERPQSKGPLL